MRERIFFWWALWVLYMCGLSIENSKVKWVPVPSTEATIYVCPDPDGSPHRPFPWSQVPENYYNRWPQRVKIQLIPGVYRTANTIRISSGLTLNGAGEDEIIFPINENPSFEFSDKNGKCAQEATISHHRFWCPGVSGDFKLRDGIYGKDCEERVEVPLDKIK